MAEHLADIKKYAKKPINEAALAGLEKTYRLVLSKADSRFVACSDPAECDTVRENFLKKKLGLSGGDLDGAIKTVCQTMKSEHNKSRLTFYYLLAEHFRQARQVRRPESPAASVRQSSGSSMRATPSTVSRKTDTGATPFCV